MTINQAFAILSGAGGNRAARIITENMPNLSRFRIWIIARQLRRGVPVAKIIHMKWFYGLRFYTNKYTLDPRPDTETLVDSVLNTAKQISEPRILDLGTGTGCILGAILHNLPNATGTGIDISRRAIRVAKHNMSALNIANRAKITRKSFARPDAVHEKFNIIVSNPPYIARGDARVNDGAHHDPDIALYADENGLAAYRKIAQNARQWIVPGGKIFLEIGVDMESAVTKIFQDAGWTPCGTHRDLGGITRVLVFNIGGENPQ